MLMAEEIYKMSNRELRGRKNSSYSNVRNAKQPSMLDNGSKVRMSPVYYILLIFLGILLISTLISFIRGVNQTITFTGFLEYLKSSPKFEFLPLSTFSIEGDWGLVDFLRVFFNSVGVALGVSIWICQLIINAFSWLLWIFRFFFI